METFDLLQNIPINSAVLKALLSNLKYPKNKISDLEKSGVFIRLKKDLYVRKKADISKELIANHLYGVSYVSLETALAYYGMIPERVYAVRSMTTKRSKTFTTPLGNFEYKTVSADYFRIGLRQEIIENQYAFLIAEPTKAVCDMIVSTPNLRLQSVKAIQNYLTEDLRIDFEVLKNMDAEIIRQCVDFGKKKNELTTLVRFFGTNETLNSLSPKVSFITKK
jgi:predicted transcriptional regulator of viral defense system